MYEPICASCGGGYSRFHAGLGRLCDCTGGPVSRPVPAPTPAPERCPPGTPAALKPPAPRR